MFGKQSELRASLVLSGLHVGPRVERPRRLKSLRQETWEVENRKAVVEGMGALVTVVSHGLHVHVARKERSGVLTAGRPSERAEVCMLIGSTEPLHNTYTDHGGSADPCTCLLNKNKNIEKMTPTFSHGFVSTVG